jgi:hypothetical protein
MTPHGCKVPMQFDTPFICIQYACIINFDSGYTQLSMEFDPVVFPVSITIGGSSTPYIPANKRVDSFEPVMKKIGFWNP